MSLYTVTEVDRIARSLRVHGQTLNKSLARTAILEDSKQFESEKSYDIFLSHSYNDAKANEERIYAIKTDMESLGFSVYVDWMEDASLDRSTVSKETADILKHRMNKCNALFFLTTETSSSSKWMPWELGYFDGIKGKVAILPILDMSLSQYKGQEYLGLYPYVDKHIATSGEITLWVNNATNVYVSFAGWLKGTAPYKRD